MAKLFGSYTYTWWQLGLLKVLLLAIGVMVNPGAIAITVAVGLPGTTSNTIIGGEGLGLVTQNILSLSLNTALTPHPNFRAA